MTKKTLTPAQRKHRNMRAAAWGAFGMGATFSLVSNVLASEPTPVGILFGTWPAVALLVAVFLFENAPRKWWITASLGLIIAVAAWASYWHIVEVASHHGVDPITAHTMPLTVDALMGIAQVILNRKATPTPAARRKPVARKVAVPAPAKLKAV
jgi:drug/metabolite transporter (DMT)-like permease